MPEAKRFVFSGATFPAAARSLVYALFFFLPLFFLPVSLDILEVNKQTLLLFLTLVSALLWIGGMLQNRAFSVRRGLINLFALLAFAGVAFSAVFSQGQYLSWIGYTTEEGSSVLSFLAYLFVFYLCANLFTEARHWRRLNLVILISAGLTGLIGVAAMFGLYLLPFDFARFVGFNTVGAMNEFAVFLSIITVYGCALWVSRRPDSSLLDSGSLGIFESVLVFLVSALAFLTLLTIDSTYAWVVFIVGLGALLALVLLRLREFPDYNRFILPLLLLVGSLPFLFWLNSPLSIQLPTEVSPNFTSTWNIAKQALSGPSLWLGTGPGTFLYDYSRFHDPIVNRSVFWNIRFDRGVSFLLTSLATLGVLGLGLLLLFLVSVLVRGLTQAAKAGPRERLLPVFAALSAFATALCAACFFSGNVTLLFCLFAFAGLVASQTMVGLHEKSFAQSPRLGLLFAFLFVTLAIGMVSVIFITGQRYLGEVAFAKAVRLDAAKAELTQVVDSLDDAASFNRWNDIYYRNLSHALLLMAAKEINTAQDGQELPQNRVQYIQALTGASINAAVRATDLAPHNVLNWLSRANIYREFVPVIGADAEKFAVEAGERAVELEPANPDNQVDLGRTFLLIADATQPLTASQDEAVKSAALAKVSDLLKKAEGAFLKAIELKADYAPAHYQLAITYERQDELEKAIATMETVAKQNQLDVGVAFQLGLLYLRRAGEGDDARAQNALEHAVELAPAYANARWFLAAVYEKQGALDKAIEQVEKVLENNADNELVKSRLERLKAGAAAEVTEPIEEGEGGVVQVPDGQPKPPETVPPTTPAPAPAPTF